MIDATGLIDAPGLVALYLSAVMLGAMVFFSGIVAPTVFTTLDPQPAARLIRRIFPRYYLLIILTGFVTALAAAFAARWLPALLFTLVAALGLIARHGILPAVNRARDAELAGDLAAGRRFARLHRASVILNVVQLVIAAVGFGQLA
ncbi:DUF4149 domain-containing protein [Tistrella mobilis]|uniref:DUF4149 domain-containing protein n=1 Tax=Tistrella mobilis TaxID=171437 RepID=UPI00355866DC